MDLIQSALKKITGGNNSKKRQTASASGVFYLVPTTLISTDGNKVEVFGPKGAAESNVEEVADIMHLFDAVGAVKKCSSDTYAEIRKLYEDDATNRTTAFFDSLIDSPSVVVSMMKRIEHLQVAVLGCGGIGSGVTYLLASMGVKSFYLWDGDLIEKSNLNRQFLYSLRDIGQLKVNVLARELNNRFDKLRIKTRAEMVDERLNLNALAKYNTVIVSADDPPDIFIDIRKKLNVDSHSVWNAGYLNGISKVVKVVKNKTAMRSDKTWVMASKISTSVGFQNFEVSARLAAAIVFSHLGVTKDYYSDYRDLTQ